MKRQRKKDLSKVHLFDLKGALNWCSLYFGEAVNLPLPKVRRKNKMTLEYLVLSEDNETVELQEQDVFGVYDCRNNTIYINPYEHDTVVQMSKTFIHEYIHYLQNNCADLSIENTWTPNFQFQEVDNSEVDVDEDSLIENEAEYYAQKEYEKLLNYLGYDNPYSRCSGK